MLGRPLQQAVVVLITYNIIEKLSIRWLIVNSKMIGLLLSLKNLSAFSENKQNYLNISYTGKMLTIKKKFFSFMYYKYI